MLRNTDVPGGVACNHSPGRYVGCHNTGGTDHGTTADRDTFENCCIEPDPGVILDNHRRHPDGRKYLVDLRRCGFSELNMPQPGRKRMRIAVVDVYTM